MIVGGGGKTMAGCGWLWMSVDGRKIYERRLQRHNFFKCNVFDFEI